MTKPIVYRALATTLPLAVLPSVGMSQVQATAARGCPPPPTAQIAASADSAPLLAGAVTEIPLIAPHDGWEIGRISWVDVGRNGLIYLLQRGDKADPVVVVNREGRVVRSWGKGLFNVPHSLRIDAAGNVWTTDTHTSTVRKFSPDGDLLLTIEVGDVPAACEWPTRGATDVAFARNGHVYVADGYTNARIVEYSPDGRKVREWGVRGSGPGEFILPHSIAIDESGTVHVADRENGRIQRFSLDGTWLGEWFPGGAPYTIVAAAGSLWLDLRAVDGTNRPRQALVRARGADGRLTGRIVPPGGHGVAVMPAATELLIPSGNKLYVLSLSH